ncbi:DUF6173 family protein [Psychrobacter arcticus]|nr:DUF6173 family protein [Psychrobacter arcticus]
MDIKDLVNINSDKETSAKNLADRIQESITSVTTKARDAASPTINYRKELDPMNDHTSRLMKFQAEASEAKRKIDNPVIQIEDSVIRHVKDFESNLDDKQEVMILAASFGSSVTFYVSSIEFNRPNLIIFHGTTETGGSTRLIQHCNQLNFLLQAVPKHDPNEKRTPIGFTHDR